MSEPNKTYSIENGTIVINRELTKLDLFVKEFIDILKKQPQNSSKAKILRTHVSLIPQTWNINMKGGVHNLTNAALALQTADLFKVPHDIVREVLQNFDGLKGHIEFLKMACKALVYSIR